MYSVWVENKAEHESVDVYQPCGKGGIDERLMEVI